MSIDMPTLSPDELNFTEATASIVSSTMPISNGADISRADNVSGQSVGAGQDTGHSR